MFSFYLKSLPQPQQCLRHSPTARAVSTMASGCARRELMKSARSTSRTVAHGRAAAPMPDATVRSVLLTRADGPCRNLFVNAAWETPAVASLRSVIVGTCSPTHATVCFWCVVHCVHKMRICAGFNLEMLSARVLSCGPTRQYWRAPHTLTPPQHHGETKANVSSSKRHKSLTPRP